MSIFHFAFNVTDLDQTRAFYGGLLGCAEGRSTDTWVDFDFFGHQLSCHLGTPMTVAPTGLVGDHKVPMPHFGIVLPYAEWRALADRLIAEGVDFVLEPQTRFAGQPRCSSWIPRATPWRSKDWLTWAEHLRHDQRSVCRPPRTLDHL